MRKITTLFALLLMAVIGASAANVAKIGTTEYATFEAAWNAVQDGETITLLADCNGNGLKAPQEKFNNIGLTVDFNGFTYTVDGNLVGSTGTETQAFQLLKDNTITFKNGTIYSEKAKFLVQNYSNLTLENMTLTLNNQNYAYAYTLSNNNGNTTIYNTTINANPAGGVAFDVCRYASYPSVSVTVTGDSYINGNIEVDASNGDPKDGMALDLRSGTLNGDIAITTNGQTAIKKDNSTADIDTPADIAENNNFDQTHHVAKIGDQGYETLAQAIAAVPENTQTTINLIANTTENVTIPAGKNIVLNFNDGVILDGGSYFGTPQHKTAAITNLGTVEIEGNGIIKRRDVAKANGDGQAAFYVILNNGTMTISDVTVVNNSGPSNPDGVWTGASLIANGTKAPATLTIESGTFTQNNFNVMKNDDYGTLTINGGTFNSANQQVIQNWNNTTINDGEFNGEIASWAWEGNGAQANPTVTISGGDFNNTVIGTYFDGNVTTNSPSISITNGTFNDCEFNESDNSEIEVSGGSFTEIVPLNVCAENYIPVTTPDPSTGMYTVGQGKVIEDGVAYNESMKSDEQINFVYTRTFTEDMVGKYQCWCAPFTVVPGDEGIPDGVEFYKIDGPATGIEAGNTIAISKITTSVDANWPVVIKVNEAGTYNFFMYGYIGANTSPIQIENDNYNITITGTYDFTTANALNEWASLNTDGQLIWSYKGDTVKPYRWILKATDKNGNSAPIHNLKFVEVDNAGIDTGISTINAVSSDSEVEAIYSANGQRLQSMQKGINIIRMKDNTVKKVIIK